MKKIATCKSTSWEKAKCALTNCKTLFVFVLLTYFTFSIGTDLKAEASPETNSLSEELISPSVHLNNSSENLLSPLTGSGCGPESINLYASDGSTLYLLDPLTGSGSAIGPIGFNKVGGIEYDNTTGIFYGVGTASGSGTPVLLTIDLITGMGTAVADLTPPPLGLGAPAFDLALRPSDGTMYMDGRFGLGCVDFGTLDLTSGSVTALGSSGTCNPGNAITFSNGILYHVDNFGDGALYTTNQITGLSTPHIPLTFTGFPPLFDPRINAMDADESGTIYASINDGIHGLGPNYLATLDPNTGIVAHIGNSPNGMDGLAWGNSTPCASDCNIQCEGLINVSLDATCEATITPAMGAIGLFAICNSLYIIEVYDENGDIVPGNLVDLSHRNQMMEFKVTEPCCSNSCWGKLTVEYKLPPKIVCPSDATLSCGAINLLGIPPAIGACADFEVILFSETHQQLLCDPLYTNIVTRTYKAIDDFGNEDVCSHTIMLERLILNDIIFPDPMSVANGNPIRCSDDLIEFDMNGIPLPWPTDPSTGSGSGVPIICDDDIVNGLICPLTGSGTGIPLIPGPFTGPGTNIPTQVGCSAVVLYTDIELPEIGCVKKIMRTWEVREWWCNGESSQGGLQLIEIIDDEAPEFECPDDFTVTTNDNCAGSVLLPGVNPIDECGHEVGVAIDYPNGFLNENGGAVELKVGVNIVTYIANDACYNTSSCDMTVTVRDKTEPVAICQQDVVVAISLTGNTIAFAESFDDGSWDECGVDRIEIRRMDSLCVASDTLFGPSISFCCTDVGQDIMVVFQVVDLGGNSNRCMIMVEVQDNSLPTMICPVDMSIDCRDAYDLNNLGVSFGNPIIIDNCAETQIVEETPSDDVNVCGIGEITRIMELKDPTGVVYQTCIQHILINDATPFVGSNIQWPLNYQFINACGLNDLLPQNLPDNYNYPIYTSGDDECNLLGFDYSDEIFEGSQGGEECALIERTWTVINWCSSVNGSFEKWVIPSPQILELINQIDPVIVDQGDLLFESGNVDCESGDIAISRTATDDCNNPLIWDYILKDNGGNIIAQGDTNVIEGVFLVGFYSIEWHVEDGCGNFDDDVQNFEVRNTKTPNPICIQGLSAALVGVDLVGNDGILDAEQVELSASYFDGGSYHTCNNAITLSLSSDTMIKTIIYDCDSIGIQIFQLWVTDVVTGAQDYCSTTIDIQDTNMVNICPQNSNRVNVSGEVYTEMFAEVEGVMVNLGVPDLDDMTDNSGVYAFEDMPIGGSYNVIPEKDTEYLNGVSTLDLIIMQRHILGIEQLNSPYKMIAADVNNSEDVSVIDLIELRKLILGVYSELPNNNSWRFVDAEYQFPDPIDPWFADIPEQYQINNLSQDMLIDFVGVKIGDVNGSVIANSNVNAGETEFRSEEALVLTFNTQVLKAEELSIIEVSSKNYNQVKGWQGTLEFDPAEIEITDIRSKSLPVNLEENFNLQKQHLGWITMSYHSKIEDIIVEDEILFEIVIKSKKDITNKQLFSLSSKITASESYSKNNFIQDLRIEDVSENGGVSIVSVNPNPWIESTEILYSTSEAGPVEWQFYDVTGRLLYKETGQSLTGMQKFSISRHQINTAGVVYVKLITSESTADYKMVILE